MTTNKPLILHRTTATEGESVQRRKGTLVAYDDDSVISGAYCNSYSYIYIARTRVQYSSPTNSPNHNCSSGTIAFASITMLYSSQFPVAICMIATNAWPRQKFSIRSSVCSLRIRRRGRRTRIYHRVSHPDADMEAANKEVAKNVLLTSGK